MSFNDLFLSSSDDAKVKLPRGFGASSSEGTVVELETNNDLGSNLIYLEMYDKDSAAEILTKKTVKNFLKYVKNDLYDNSILHRSVPGFVLQGGGFVAPSAPSSEGGVPVPINSYGTVKNQPGNSNLRGTIAMAKIAGDPDSATSQWYINLEDNISLDSQNEGFTVFGHVMGDGMSVVDDLSSANVYNNGESYKRQLEIYSWLLQKNGFEVFVLTDGVGSRSNRDSKLAIKRLSALGVSLINLEMMIFELIRDSKHDMFKYITQKYVN